MLSSWLSKVSNPTHTPQILPLLTKDPGPASIVDQNSLFPMLITSTKRSTVLLHALAAKTGCVYLRLIIRLRLFYSLRNVASAKKMGRRCQHVVLRTNLTPTSPRNMTISLSGLFAVNPSALGCLIRNHKHRQEVIRWLKSITGLPKCHIDLSVR